MTAVARARRSLADPPRRAIPERLLFLISLVLVVSIGCGGPVVEYESGPLPPDGFLNTWHREASPRVFEGADLYGHINGGAEVFLELGFDRLDVVRYDADGAAVEVERYRMTDPVAALGIYLMKCGAVPYDRSGCRARHLPDEVRR
jgi:hypothetical protein